MIGVVGKLCTRRAFSSKTTAQDTAYSDPNPSPLHHQVVFVFWLSRAAEWRAAPVLAVRSKLALACADIAVVESAVVLVLCARLQHDGLTSQWGRARQHTAAIGQLMDN